VVLTGCGIQVFFCSTAPHVSLFFSSSHHFIFIVKHCPAWKTIFLVHLILMRNPIVLLEDFSAWFTECLSKLIQGGDGIFMFDDRIIQQTIL